MGFGSVGWEIWGIGGKNPYPIIATSEHRVKGRPENQTIPYVYEGGTCKHEPRSDEKVIMAA